MNSFPPSDSAAIRAAIQSAFDQAERAWSAQDPTELVAALQTCNHLLESLPPEQSASDDQPPLTASTQTDVFSRERALLWLWRGRLLVAADQVDAVVHGLQSLDQAIARLSAMRTDEQDEVTTASLAIAWMNRGSGLFRLGTQEALTEGVRSYVEAITLMERAPHAEPNALGAAWMNRGVGLLHLADNAADTTTSTTNDKSVVLAIRLTEAAAALEKAIVILEPIATGHHAARRNLASSWANLGMIRSRLRDPAGAAEAHCNSVDIFRPLANDGDASESIQLAARLFNLAQAAGAAANPERALSAGRESLALTDTLSHEDPQALDLGLRTRHALCIVLSGFLKPDSARSPDQSPTPEQSAHIEDARMLIEDGLALLRAQPSPAPSATAIGARLYEFGAWLHRTWCPVTLGAFLLEHLDNNPAREQIAASAIQQTQQAVMQRGFADVAHGGVEGMLDTLRSLSPVEERLNARAR